MSLVNSFDDVVALYNNIKPLRGKRSYIDIRPLGDRKRWWERVIKVNDNTYVITDGGWSWGVTPEQLKNDPQKLHEVLCFSPIVWTREADGDYVTIRNNLENGSSVSRYELLKSWLPAVLRFSYNQNGKHWVDHVSKNSKHYLPKFKAKITDGKWGSTEDLHLKFKQTQGDFISVVEPHKARVSVVNREVTKLYNPKIKELWQWAETILPVFGATLMEQRDQSAKVIGAKTVYGWIYNVNPNDLRAWLDGPDLFADERLAFVILSTFSIDAIEGNWNNGVWFAPTKTTYEKFKNLVHKLGNMKMVKLVDVG